MFSFIIAWFFREPGLWIYTFFVDLGPAALSDANSDLDPSVFYLNADPDPVLMRFAK